jgi:hypothetical protein
MSLAINSRKNNGKFFSVKYCFSNYRQIFRNPASGHRLRYRCAKSSDKKQITTKLVRIISIIVILLKNNAEDDEDDSSSSYINTTEKR